MFFSCIKAENHQQNADNRLTSTLLKSDINIMEKTNSLDVFIFEQSGKLDCYQRIVNPGPSCEIASGSGFKQVFIVANSQNEKYDWAYIRNLSTMADIYVELEDERREAPVMTSLSHIYAGEQMNIELLPLRSEIMLNSLRCDFSEEDYYNKYLTDVKIYLTNVNANYSLIPDNSSKSSRFINTSMLDTEHLSRFVEHDMITQNIDSKIGNTATKIQKSLFCYANQPTQESIGSPATKLVIEGKIDNDTYYYPIKINPEGGIARGNKYIFDIVLTRAGVTDPDGELEETDINIKMEVERWKEKDGYEVRF